MKDLKLTALNFEDLLQYGGQPKVQHEYTDVDRPVCSGYCVSCDLKFKPEFEKSKARLDMMSHGCDTSDFEAILGPFPRNSKETTIDYPVFFLLEDPGSYWKSGSKKKHLGFEKQPPDNHYYWTPTKHPWELMFEHIKENWYGNYFAYLMWKHRLSNAYITNLRKCRLLPKVNTGNISKNCVDTYLKRELSIFQPKLIFCFGCAAYNGLNQFADEYKPLATRLYHPSARCSSSRTIDFNNRRIEERIRTPGRVVETSQRPSAPPQQEPQITQMPLGYLTRILDMATEEDDVADLRAEFNRRMGLQSITADL